MTLRGGKKKLFKIIRLKCSGCRERSSSDGETTNIPEAEAALFWAKISRKLLNKENQWGHSSHWAQRFQVFALILKKKSYIF